MKTKTQLLEELDDQRTLLNDAIKAGQWTLATGAAWQIERLCRFMPAAEPQYITMDDIQTSLSKLGALLEQGSANVVHGE